MLIGGGDKLLSKFATIQILQNLITKNEDHEKPYHSSVAFDACGAYRPKLAGCKSGVHLLLFRR
jgi:hypothetical protein